MDTISRECPRCGSTGFKNIIDNKDGSNNIDGIGSFHLKCNNCEYQFNVWKCNTKTLKDIFGEDIYKLYL